MENNKVINSIYLIPALLEALEGNKEQHILDILKEFEIDNIEEYRGLNSLLKYHYKIIKNDFNGEDLYPLLRKGLNEYYDKYLNDFWKIINIQNTNKKLLDYGCGTGCYSRSFKKDNPKGSYILIDKSLGIDFENNPNWYINDHIEKYDLILLSEILHCKDYETQNYLINSSLDMLKTGGQIIINENEDPFMDWRLNKLTKKGEVLNKKYILDFMNRSALKLSQINKINYHNIFVYDKI